MDEQPLSRIFLVDDHPLVREGLTAHIDRAAGLTVCGEADGADEALLRIGSLRPDLVLLDLSLKKGSGLELIKRIRSTWPDIKLLVVSMHEADLYAARVRRAGAMGYINKRCVSEQIVAGIRCVLDGGLFFHAEQPGCDRNGAPPSVQAAASGGMVKLSNRELQVFELIGRGLPTRDIATHLHISGKTVEAHREHIKTKLGLESAHALSLRAMQWIEDG